MARRWIGRTLIAVGCLLVLAGAAYGGVVEFMVWRESVSPSTGKVLVLRDGRRISLVQPTPNPQRSTLTLGKTAPGVAVTPLPKIAGVADPQPQQGDELPPQVVESVESDAFLPPTRIGIRAIGADWPVVLSHNDHMPRFKGVGWLMGSAYPGHAGNFVLFGHMDGPYATFGKLSQLKVGDLFTVQTPGGDVSYSVRELRQTERDDVEVLAPTDEPTATLITCSGHWDSALQDYTHRLIVTAVHVGP